MTLRIFRIILPVPDIEKGQEFYEFLLDKKGTRVSPGRHYFDCNGVILAVFDPRADTDEWDAQPNPGHIYFAVSDLESLHRRALTAGCKKVPAGDAVFGGTQGLRRHHAPGPGGQDGPLGQDCHGSHLGGAREEIRI